jgi:hypothetical protein
MEKQELVKNLKHELDAMFALKTNNATGAMSYQDMCQMCDYVEEYFVKNVGETPLIVRHSLEMARGLMSPHKVEMLQHLKNGLGGLLVISGGLGIVFGILSALGVGAGIWAAIVAFVVGPAIPVLGPIAIAVGVGAIALGIYLSIKNIGPKVMTSYTYEKVIIKSLNMWLMSKDELEKEDVKAKEEIHRRSETDCE